MSEEESPVIRVKDLEKIYTGGVHAVKGVRRKRHSNNGCLGFYG